MRRLLVGYLAVDLTAEMLEGETVFHVLDIYHKHAIERVFPQATVVCSAHLPEGPWDQILFKTGPRRMPGEVALSLLQEISGARVKDFKLDYVGKVRDRETFLDHIRKDKERVRSFRAEWPASVPGGPQLTFVSYPGCFCHRRLDDGGLALAEVVSRILKEETSTRNAPFEILDMGCGCGLVSCLIASLVPNVHLTLIDSHSRAVEAAQENVQRFGLSADVILADNGIDSLKGMKHKFDVFVGNPPYYSDYRIADVFLDTAKKALKWGGRCWTVCKNAAGLEPVQLRYFPRVETHHRRGYAVLESTHIEEA